MLVSYYQAKTTIFSHNETLYIEALYRVVNSYITFATSLNQRKHQRR